MVIAFDPVILTLGISPKMQLEIDLFKILINDSLQSYPKSLKHSNNDQWRVKYITYIYNEMPHEDFKISSSKNN